MNGIKGERVLMRIHVEEDATWNDKPLYEAIVELLRDRKFAGATVFRGLEGWSAWWHHHAHPSTQSTEATTADLSMVIEAIDTPDQIVSLLPTLDGMIGRGVITLERAKVIVYRPHGRSASDHDDLPTKIEGGSIDLGADWRSPTDGDTSL